MSAEKKMSDQSVERRTSSSYTATEKIDPQMNFEALESTRLSTEPLCSHDLQHLQKDKESQNKTNQTKDNTIQHITEENEREEKRTEGMVSTSIDSESTHFLEQANNESLIVSGLPTELVEWCVLLPT